jgi:zinc transport system permease protein
VTITALTLIWRSFLSSTVNEDLAKVEGVPVTRARLVFTLLIAGTIAVGMKIVGILLIISLLIIPAAAARRLSATPEQMAVIAAIIGVLSVVAGLFGSLRWDIPAGPAIVVAATACFVTIMAWPRRRTPHLR